MVTTTSCLLGLRSRVLSQNIGWGKRMLKIRVYVSAIIILIGAMGCSRSPSTALRVGYIPVTHGLQLYEAQSGGIFRDNSLSVEMVPFSGGPSVLQALASGDIDVGFSNVVSTIRARSEGLPFIIITGGPVEDSLHVDHSILVRSDGAIRKPTDLIGKTIAINARQNIDHLMLVSYLELHNIREQDVEIREVPFPRMLSVLASKQVDAIASAEPFITIGTSGGTVRVLSQHYLEVADTTFVASYVTTENKYQSHREMIDSFVESIESASVVVMSDPDRARILLSEYTQLQDSVSTRVSTPRFVGSPDMVSLRRTISLMVRHGMLDSPELIEGLSQQ